MANQQYKEGEILTNSKTGQKIQLRNNKWVEYFDPTEGMSQTEKFLAGTGRGMVNIARNIGNLVGIVSDEQMRDAAALDEPLMRTSAGKAGSFIGETAALLPVGGLAGAGLKAAGKTIGQQLAENLIARGATEGAAQGILTASPNERGSGAAIGATLGAAIPFAGSSIKNIIAGGIRPTRAAKTLLQEGVELTPGQMTPTGAINQIEQALMGVPVVGKIISGQRQKGWEQTQRIIGQQASPPNFVPKTVGDVNKLVDEIGDAYSNAYKIGEGYPMAGLYIMRVDGPDIPLSQAFKSSLRTNANPDAKKYANGFLTNELEGLQQKRGGLASEDLFALRSRIRDEIRKLKRNLNAPFGADDILESAENRVTDVLESQLPSNIVPEIRAIDAKYGNFKILQNAVRQAGDKPGGFTPAQFSQAVRQDAASLGTYAAGGGRMRPFAKAAYETFQPNEPLTGRQAITLAPLAYGLTKGLAASPVATGIAALGGGALWGTRTGRELLSGQTLKQQQLRNLLRKGRRNLTPEQRESIVRLLQTIGVESALGGD